MLIGRISCLSPIRWPKLDLTALLHDAAHNPTKRPVVDNAALDAVDVVAESGDFISPQEQAARLLRRPIGGYSGSIAPSTASAVPVVCARPTRPSSTSSSASPWTRAPSPPSSLANPFLMRTGPATLGQDPRAANGLSAKG